MHIVSVESSKWPNSNVDTFIETIPQLQRAPEGLLGHAVLEAPVKKERKHFYVDHIKHSALQSECELVPSKLNKS